MPRKRGKRGNGGVTERPNGRYQAQWSTTEGGRRVRKSETFILKADAEWWLRQAKRGEAPDVDLTVGEYLERWLLSRRSIRRSTAALYDSHLRVHIIPALGHLPLTTLQPRHVEAFVTALGTAPSRTGKPLQPATIRGVVTTLRSALAYGVRRRELPDNAADGVETPEFRPEPVVPMTNAEASALIEAVRGHWLELLVRLVLGSGIRIGEALALDQRDVEPGFVRIRRPKTVPRAAYVSEDAAAALAEAIRTAPRRGPREPVFYGPKSGDRLTREVVTHALPRRLEAAGLTRRTPHGLRHGVATLMLSNDVPLSVIAEQMGHRSLRMTARYAHVVPALQRRAVGVMDQAIRKR